MYRFAAFMGVLGNDLTAAIVTSVWGKVTAIVVQVQAYVTRQTETKQRPRQYSDRVHIAGKGGEMAYYLPRTTVLYLLPATNSSCEQMTV